MPKVSRESAAQAVSLEGLQIHTEDLEGGYTVCFESHSAEPTSRTGSAACPTTAARSRAGAT